MDKKDVVHVYNGILLSHKKELNWVISRDGNESKVCQTEWNKSEREKQILYIYKERQCQRMLKLQHNYTHLTG